MVNLGSDAGHPGDFIDEVEPSSGALMGLEPTQGLAMVTLRSVRSPAACQRDRGRMSRATPGRAETALGRVPNHEL